jgi:hypothetical protein
MALMINYSAAKAAVSNFTCWLAVHLAHVGIRVNAIAPGFLMTEQLKFLHVDRENGRTHPAGSTGNGSHPYGTLRKTRRIAGRRDLAVVQSITICHRCRHANRWWIFVLQHLKAILRREYALLPEKTGLGLRRSFAIISIANRRPSQGNPRNKKNRDMGSLTKNVHVQ